MPFKPIPIWREAPFLRLIIPFIIGIIVQWHYQLSITVSLIAFFLLILFYILFQSTKKFFQFKSYWLNGLIINLLLVFIGCMLTYYRDISHATDHINNYYKSGNTIIATLEEPLLEKENSYKAHASMEYVAVDNNLHFVKGSMLVYFKKDSSISNLNYGTQIIFNKPLQTIKNAGNPDAFDYKRYCALQGIYHQVFLSKNEFAVLPQKNENTIKKFVFSTREKTLAIFRKYIPGEKERGLAEALLLGYRDDLDKNLIQSYTNTGVIHLIAVSGLQVILIYGFLIFLFKPFTKFRVTKKLQPFIILAIIWLFSLMSGASASVLRAAVMLTFIVIGNCLSRKTAVYNNLAASAFLLLCYNPLSLWNIGFQLSYFAVFGIVTFTKPLCNIIYIQNKILDFIWELTCVSLSAQLMVAPLIVFYYHQFPTYFLLTNLVAAPLAGIILFSELILCIISFIPLFATFVGIVLEKLIWLLNSYIEHIETMPFVGWNNLQINIWQVIFLYAFVACIAIWLMRKKKNYFQLGLVAFLGFMMIRSYSFCLSNHQQKMIVYNVPKYQAIDFISGRNFVFEGDDILRENEFLRDFNMQPYHIAHRISEMDSISDLQHDENIYEFNQKRILVIDSKIPLDNLQTKTSVDIIILSKNPSLKIADLTQIFNCREWVFDSSNSAWKISKWKKECEQLHLSCFDVVDNGAFVLNLD